MIGRKKIFYLITKPNQGGAQRNVYDLATSLPKEGFDVTVYAGGGLPTDRQGWLFDALREKNIRAESLPLLARDINLAAEISVFFRLMKLFKKERPDIVHLHSSKIGGLGALAGRITGVPNIIFTAHGWSFNEPWRSLFSRGIIWILSLLTALLCHHVVTITKKDTAQARRMPFVWKTKIAYIPNGIAETAFLPRAEARIAILGARKAAFADDIWVGTISELTKNKGLGYAISAIADLKKKTAQPFRFVIIGEGEDRTTLENQIRNEHLSNTVFLAGHKENAASLLKAFNIFTLTSLKEGLPYVLLEAGLAETSVLASRVGGIPDIVEHEVSGILVPPEDTDAVANTLVNLMSDRGKARIMAKNLRKNILANFSFEKMVADMQVLYK